MKYLGYGLLLSTVFWFGCRPSVDEKELAYNKTIERTKPQDGFPKPIGYINDYDSILSITQKNILQDKLQRYDNLTYNRILLVTVPNYYQYSTIDDFAHNLGEQWDMTKKEIANAIFVILNPTQKEVRIQTDETSKNFIQDSIKEKIIESTLQPAFDQKNIFDALLTTVDELIRVRQESSK